MYGSSWIETLLIVELLLKTLKLLLILGSQDSSSCSSANDLKSELLILWMLQKT